MKHLMSDALTSCRAKEITETWGCDWISNIYPTPPMIKPFISRAVTRAASLEEMVVLIGVSNKVPVFNPHWITSKSHARRYRVESPVILVQFRLVYQMTVSADNVRGHCGQVVESMIRKAPILIV